jgi:hypothetical protein
MRYFKLLINISLLALFGCQSDTTIPSDNIIVSTMTPVNLSSDNRLSLVTSDLIISVLPPTDWIYHQMDSGIVMAEPNTTSGHTLFNGIIFHIWTHPIYDLELVDTTSSQSILEQITKDPIYVGNTTITKPQPFHWDGIDASYYIFNNQLGHTSLIIGMTLPQHPQLIAISISAPTAQVDHLREQSLRLLDGIVINDITITADVLDDVLPPSLMIAPRSTESN